MAELGFHLRSDPEPLLRSYSGLPLDLQHLAVLLLESVPMFAPQLQQYSSPREWEFLGDIPPSRDSDEAQHLTELRLLTLLPVVTKTVRLKKVKMHIVFSLSGLTNDLLIQKSPLFIELCLPLGGL